MSNNFLQLNEEKTDILATGSQHLVNDLLPSAGSLFSNVKTVAKNLGIWFEGSATFEWYTTKQCNLFYHLRNIAKFRSILSFTPKEALVTHCQHKTLLPGF